MTVILQEKESPVSVRFSGVLGQQLSFFSQARKQSKSSVIQEAVQNYLELQEWQAEGVKKAILEMEDGKGINGDIFLEWMESLGIEDENQIPSVSFSSKK